MELEGIAAADAHLGRPVPLPRVALGLVRWSTVNALAPGAVEVEFNLDDSRPGAPGRLALYVGFEAPPQRDWPEDPAAPPALEVRVGGEAGRLREAALPEAQPSLRPAVEISWRAHGLHLRLTAQGPWERDRLVEIAASV